MGSATQPILETLGNGKDGRSPGFAEYDFTDILPAFSDQKWDERAAIPISAKLWSRALPRKFNVSRRVPISSKTMQALVQRGVEYSTSSLTESSTQASSASCSLTS